MWFLEIISRYFPFHSIYRFPWDQHNIQSWTFELVFIVFAGCSYFIVNGILLSFFIGICIYHRAYYKIMQALLDNIETEGDYKSKRKVKHLLIKTMGLHNSAKNVFIQSAEALSSSVLIWMIFSMILLAASIFQVDLVRRSVL